MSGEMWWMKKCKRETAKNKVLSIKRYLQWRGVDTWASMPGWRWKQQKDHSPKYQKGKQHLLVRQDPGNWVHERNSKSNSLFRYSRYQKGVRAVRSVPTWLFRRMDTAVPMTIILAALPTTIRSLYSLPSSTRVWSDLGLKHAHCYVPLTYSFHSNVLRG